MDEVKIVDNPKEAHLEGNDLSEMKLDLGARIKKASNGNFSNIITGEIIDIDSLLEKGKTK